MAIFYEHIKGCGLNNNYTSWIKWSDESSAPKDIDAKYLPKILIGTDTTNGKKDFGTLITSNAVNQSVDESFRFNKDITVFRGIYLKYNQSENGKCSILADDDGNFTLTNPDGNFTLTSANNITFKAAGSVSISSDTTGSGKLTANTINVSGELTAQTISVSGELTANTIEADDKCQAKYFNATSDARAKSNITPTQFSALSIVNKLPIYTFNYLNDPKLSVGLIAQEAAEHDLDGFNMVDNPDATGEFGDFMHIKESKLVYVLWKAVQELSAEVESLKAQLNNRK